MEEERQRFILARSKPTPRIGEAPGTCGVSQVPGKFPKEMKVYIYSCRENHRKIMEDHGNIVER